MALALGGVLLWSAPAEAQATTVLVKNTGQTSESAFLLNASNNKRAQEFTTGTSPHGYTLSSIGILFGNILDLTSVGSELTATLHLSDGTNPGTELCTLTDPPSFVSNSLNTFIAPTTGTGKCPTLDANTKHFVVIERVGTGTSTISVRQTTSSSEATGAARGWSIANDRRYFSSSAWSTDTGAHLIEVKGSANAPANLLIKNSAQSPATGTASSLDSDISRYAQSFTTGSNDDGYTLNSIGIDLYNVADTSTAGAELTATLNTISSGSPGTALCTLTDPGSFTSTDVHTFVAPTTDPCPALKTNTSYFFVITRANTTTDEIKVNFTRNDSEDSGGAAGWSIGNAASYYSSSTWSSNTGLNLMIEVTGTALYIPRPTQELPTGVEVPTDWGLIPSGLGAGDSFRLLFLSSTTRNGESTNITVYNDFVQDLAAAGHTAIQPYSSQFRAVACTSTVDARYNTQTTGTGVRVHWLGGAKAADHYGDFYDGSWDEEATVRNESGTAVTISSNVSTYDVWTGCDDDGTEGMSGGVSLALGTSGPALGRLNGVGAQGPLYQLGTDPKANTNYFYGLSPVFVVMPPPDVEVPSDWGLIPAGLEAGDRFRLLFLSSTTRNAESTDITVYNDFVQDLAAAGHTAIQPYSSQFRAVACTSTVDARYNTQTTGTVVRVHWLGGAKAADHYGDFYDGSWDEEATVRNESGTAVTISSNVSTYDVWTGCDDDGTEGMSGGVSLALGTSGPALGRLNGVGAQGPLYQLGTDPKANTNYLYGLSPVFVVMPPPDVEVPSDWGLIPAGLEAGDRFRLLFLSSTTRNAESTDITVYNDFVQDLAAAGHTAIQPYSSQFRAVACTSTVDARYNTKTTGTGVRVHWLGGAKAADHYGDFYDGSWDEEVTVRNESGTAVTISSNVSTYDVWTGCDDDGTEGMSGGVSLALGTSGPALGRLNGVGAQGPLYQLGTDPKANTNYLYGLSPVFVVTVVEPEPPPVIPAKLEIPVDWVLKPSGLEAGDRFRLLFLSSTTRNAESTSIATYNGFVQDLAAAGHTDIQAYASQFRAVACTSAVDAVDNTGTQGTGVPVHWLGGAKAADHYGDFYDGSWDEEATVRNESGASVTIPFQTSDFAAWSGCEHNGTEGMDGTDSLALGVTNPGIGTLNHTVGANRGPLNQNDSKDPKADTNHLYGLSPVFVVMPPSRVIPVDWNLKPSGLEAGDRFRLLFLSSTTRNAESTSIATYNGFVQDLAAAGHTDIQAYASQFRAVACTSAVDAVDNTGTQGTGVPVHWLGGAKAADGNADFYDGSWDEEATVRNESGASVTIPSQTSDFAAWSGCEHNGTEGMDGTDSLALGVTNPGIGTLNHAVGANRGPLNQNDSKDPKADTNHLYGLSPVFVVMPPSRVIPVDWNLKPSGLEAGDRFRLLFLSSTTRNAESTSIATYNGFVQDLAAAGHTDIQAYASQFRAVACTSAVDAVDNTGTQGTGVPVHWLGGAKAADGNADFYDGSWDEEVTVRNESGASVTIPSQTSDFAAWSGCEHNGTEGMDGTDSLALGVTNPGIGTLNHTVGANRGPLNQNDSKDPKADTNHLYGLSPLYAVGLVVTPPPAVVPDQDPILVKNTGQTPSAQVWALSDDVPKRAQAFTTGTDASYTLSSIGFRFDEIADTSTASSELTVTLNANNDGDPGTALCTLSNPSSFSSNVLNTFDAPATCPTLARNTTYFALIERATVTTNIVLKATGSTKEDPGAAPGWSISNGRRYFQSGSWRDFSTQSHQIEVRGTSDGPPPLTVKFGLADYSVAEGSTVTIKIHLSEEPGQTVTIPLTRTNQGGASSSDYSGVPTSITFNSGETEKSFTFTAAQDTVADGGEAVHLAFGTLPSILTAGTPNEATVHITDIEAPEVTVSFEHPTRSLSEGDNVAITVLLNANPERTVVVPLTRTNQNGASSADYSGVPASVTFRAGQMTRSFTFTAAQDAEHDDGESVKLGFGALPPKVTAGTTSEVTISITDREQTPANRPPTASATADPTTVFAGGTVLLDGTASDPDSEALTLAWTSDGGGTFFPGPGILDTAWIAPAIETAHTVNLTLTVTDDHGLSSSVTVRVLVEPPPPPNAATGLNGQVADDNVVSLTWTLPNQPSVITVANVLVQQRMSGGQFSVPTWDTITTLPPSATSHTVEGLQANTTFRFRIRLTSTLGTYADSEHIDVRTLKGAPAPRHFAAYWLTQTSITLDWSTVETAAEYRLEYRKQGETDWTRITGDFDHLPSTSDHRQAFGVAAGLECETQYHFQLSARGSGETRNDGDRYPSTLFGSHATTSAQTGECAQEEEVTNLLVSVEPACATLTWTPPSGGRDTGYRVERYSYTGNRSQRSEPETLVEQANRVADRYQDCSAAYRTGGAEHAYIVTALDNDPEPDEEGAFGSAYTSILVYGPDREPEGPRNVRLSHDTRNSRRLAWDAPRDPWLTTVRTARAGSGPQQVVTDPRTTGYRVERREYRRTEDGGWFLPEFDDETLLTATMTVGHYDPPGTDAGYSSAENPFTAGGLTTDTFSDGSTTYRVRHILWVSGTQLLVTVNPSPPASVYDNWRLLFGGEKYPFSEVTPTDAPGGGSSFYWYEPNQPWSISDAVSIELVKREILDWKALREETDVNASTSFTDATDKGDRQYVYRVWAYSDRGLNHYSFRGDWAFNGGDPGGDPEPAGYVPPPPAQQQGGETPSNNPATGAPAISGTPQVGEILTASTSGIADSDGLTNASYSWQWIAGGADIDGATGSSYELTGSEQRETIRVRVTFTDDRGNAETITSVATDPVAARPTPAVLVTASFSNVPADHNGGNFTFDLNFSENVLAGYARIRDDAFTMDGGDIKQVQRKEQGSNRGWTITVEPEGNGAVSITLPETTDCDATGAICTDDSRKLSHSTSTTVAGPPAISVSDAAVQEAEGAVLVFTATLSRASSRTVTVDYATSDGSAQAGSDYTAASGTLTFNAGETSQTVQVTVLTDSEDESQETLTLTLSNPSQATLDDATGAGAIENGESSSGTQEDPPEEAPVVLLTASFGNMPATHNGSAFTFDLTFSENVKAGYARIRDHAFTVSGASTIASAVRKTQGSNQNWTITVQPEGNGAISITLPPTTDCDDDGAICTQGGKKLSNRNELAVSGPS